MTATTVQKSARNRAPKINRDDELIAFVREYIKENGHSPSYEEIKASLGLRSKGSVYNMIRKLVEEGRISHTPERARTLRVL